MCGIIGIWAKNNLGIQELPKLSNAVEKLKHRGPDAASFQLYENCGFGHTRLSIIDTDVRSNQPFISEDARYTMVFNGEIYNYRDLRANLEQEGVHFKTSGDTEVLFELLKLKGKAALQLLDGFFAFAFYDAHEQTILLARDRIGIKPLLVYEDEDKIIFSSELQPFFDFGIKVDVNETALNNYFGFTYTPAPATMLKNVVKILPGQLAEIKAGELHLAQYYSLEVAHSTLGFEEAKIQLRKLVKTSVNNRLLADVPVGCFLSGGVDSSVIAAVAIQEKPDLHTFSIGFDHPYFNEAGYAKEVAKHIGSNHTEFILTKDDFKENFQDFLKTIDEPFADSSAFAVYMLSKKTKPFVTVALSGDGADELFGGYRKHKAMFQMANLSGTKRNLIKWGAGFLKPLKSNRSSRIGEFNRKLQKLNKGLKDEPKDRYLNWCQFIESGTRKKLFSKNFKENSLDLARFDWNDLNAQLFADQTYVLPNDMLKKVDLMSMAFALEVRVPFLDHKIVEFANSLPFSYKVNNQGGKQLLKAAFSDLLPASVFNRPKKGFEIPLKDWLGETLDAIFEGELFTKEYLARQGQFEWEYIQTLRKNWQKSSFGDSIYLVWALVVYQYWWNRNIHNI
ncbi:MAG: asparagine synthase (glutamine-hydrolyzing) [Crocinitomix sp.]|nr:asparagine synthase (glutamine-hydrolyzing) [Crocinitomix sp.]